MKNTVGRDEEHALWRVGIQPMLSVDLAACFRLDRTEVNHLFEILLQDELHTSVAKVADSVKEQEVFGE